MDKPLSLIIDDFKTDLANVINNSNLPPVILKPVIKEIYDEIKLLQVQELQNDKIKYNEYLNSIQEPNVEKTAE